MTLINQLQDDHSRFRHRLGARKLFALITGVWMFSGCYSSNAPPLGTVQGVVTFNGKPIESGRITFVPLDGGRSSEGTIQAGGQYRLVYSINAYGAKVGTHTVKFSTQNENGQGETIPAKFNLKSELTAEVNSGKNTLNFDLQD